MVVLRWTLVSQAVTRVPTFGPEWGGRDVNGLAALAPCLRATALEVEFHLLRCGLLYSHLAMIKYFSVVCAWHQ
jgi:hypothetical protein